MEEKDIPNPEENTGSAEITLKNILEECMDSPGYVIFTAALSKQRDEKGVHLINYKYRRYHLSLEDTRRAVEEFKRQYVVDINRDI